MAGVLVPELLGREALTHAGFLLSCTEQMHIINGIAQIWSREARWTYGAGLLLADAYADRHVLGLGLGGARPGIKPMAAMNDLDELDALETPNPTPKTPIRRILAAYGPKMLELARDRAAGAACYHVNVAHTAPAREILGPDTFLGVEHAVLFESDPDKARAIAREHLNPYLTQEYNIAKFRWLGMVGAVSARTIGTLRSGRFPLIVGGDCPVLLGGLAAVRSHAGSVGMLFVDGHEDAWPPARSTTGEAADSELGLALGRHTAELPVAFAEQLPLLGPNGVIALGPRDEQELADEGIESLAGQITMIRTGALHAAHADGSLVDLTSRQAARLSDRTGSWWLHVDLDVLATDELPAIDYPQPGGLSWAELDVITATALTSPGCAGWSLCIYNPDLDPDRGGASRILGYLDRTLAAVRGRDP